MNNPETHRIHYVYMIPTDKTNIASSVIQNAALHHQSWYQYQLGNTKTITLTDPIVTIFNTSHDSMWYSTNPAGDEQWWFWDNVMDEAHSIGVGFNQPLDKWVLYVDAPLADGQAIGGTSGVAMLCSEDIQGLLGQDPTRTVCRQIGGDAHELGHALGLHHPDVHDPQYGIALMGTGYAIYPSCILRDEDKATLNASLFITSMNQKKPPHGLCPFYSPQTVSVRPRPEVKPRPV